MAHAICELIDMLKAAIDLAPAAIDCAKAWIEQLNLDRIKPNTLRCELLDAIVAFRAHVAIAREHIRRCLSNKPRGNGRLPRHVRPVGKIKRRKQTNK